MQPLVLAIEPDHRQAAIVKRIVREKVLANVTVVDSRDAALEAMRTTIPDVLLVSTLLSPRDEDELIAHLRTLRDAEHLQTHTIPQLASSIDDDDAKPSRGLLSAFRRRKPAGGAAPAGCDPDLFAEEIRAYLKRASDKKREVKDTGAMAPLAPRVATAPPAKTAAPSPAAAETAGPASSWESPFEWRPSRSQTRSEPPTPTTPEPESFAAGSSSRIPDLESLSEPEPPLQDLESLIAPLARTGDPDPIVAEPLSIVRDPEPEPVATEQVAREETPPVLLDWRSKPAEPEPLPALDSSDRLPEPIEALVAGAVEAVLTPAPRVKYPLTMRTAKGWWFVEGKDAPVAGEPHSEWRAVLAQLAIPSKIAGVTYAEGCRIRRVRLTVAA